VTSTGCASGSTINSNTQKEKKQTEPVDNILEQLNKRTTELESYQSQIEYKFVQPSLFDSQDTRKGMLYYVKEANISNLRINFLTRQQDEEQEQKYLEQYIVLDGSSLNYPGKKFEGTWLVCIDYQIKEIKLVQLGLPDDPNKPVDVFELAGRNLPIVGFTKIEDLKEQFEVSLVEQENKESQEFTQIHLKVKPDSVYKDDYTYIDFWVDKRLKLPVKIIAQTTEKDFYEIKFLKPKINKKIDKKIFDFKIPKDFGEPEIIPLKEKDEQ
jgi:hypothetical protein